MYYSRPFKHQDRGRDRGRSYEEHRGRGQDDRSQDESISGVLNNFSKALGTSILTPTMYQPDFVLLKCFLLKKPRDRTGYLFVFASLL